MSNKFIAFCQAILYLLSFFINMYCTKLATVYDPALRSIELFVMGAVAMGCLIGCMVQLGKLFYKPIPKELNEHH